MAKTAPKLLVLLAILVMGFLLATSMVSAGHPEKNQARELKELEDAALTVYRGFGGPGGWGRNGRRVYAGRPVYRARGGYGGRPVYRGWGRYGGRPVFGGGWGRYGGRRGFGGGWGRFGGRRGYQAWGPGLEPP